MRESPSSVLGLLLVAGICCAASLFIAAGGLGLLVGFIRGNSVSLLIGLGLVIVGSLWWRSRRKRCGPGNDG